MAKGFKLIDGEVGWHPKEAENWKIVGVELSLEWPRTLMIRMQCGAEGEAASVVVTGVTSFRVQDEREMPDYWRQLHTEGVSSGTFYSIETSDYLSDLSGGVSAAAHSQIHYLISAEAECIDFLGPGWGHTPMTIEVTFDTTRVRLAR